MREDHTWKALFQPGESEGYFDTHHDKPFPDSSTGYNPLTAWYCAELCRLVYRQGGDEGGGRLPTRKQILNEVGLDELEWITAAGTACMIVANRDSKIIVFRGTNDLRDWLTNVDILGTKAHLGFDLALRRVIPQLKTHLQDGGEVLFTGHSLGGALAVLACLAFSADGRPHPVYTFGAPRASRGVAPRNVFRVVNHRDSVPTLPLPFEHAGEIRFITRKGEMKLKPNGWTQFVDKLKRCAPVDVTNPPEHLTDHAPVNYVARLEGLVGEK